MYLRICCITPGSPSPPAGASPVNFRGDTRACVTELAPAAAALAVGEVQPPPAAAAGTGINLFVYATWSSAGRAGSMKPSTHAVVRTRRALRLFDVRGTVT